jgi:diaminopimelate decarboxylase
MPKHLPINYNLIQELDGKYSTPFYFYDEEGIRLNSIKYIDSFKKYFPKFKQYFAVKALPNPSILQILADCGMGFDCSSPEEIKIVQLLDKHSEKKSDIIYTSNYTSCKDLYFARSLRNVIINLDDIDGLYNLINISTIPPTILCFRYSPDIDITNPDIKSNKLSGCDTKFGMDLIKLIKSYKLAKEYGVKRFGLHTMCVSNSLDLTLWSKIIDELFCVIDILKKEENIEIEFIDIGGGIGIPYKPKDEEIDIEKLAVLIRNSFDENIKKFAIRKEPILYTECGRYITGPYGWMIAKCQSIKTTKNIYFYGLDASMANLMRPGMYNAYHHITIPRLCNENKIIEANIVGTLCENNDWFAKQRDLPCGIEKGDLFVIHDCGAHAHSMGFNYNSKLRCTELLLTNKKDIVKIRSGEKFKDLIRNTKMYKDNKNYKICFNAIAWFIIFVLIYVFIL